MIVSGRVLVSALVLTLVAAWSLNTPRAVRAVEFDRVVIDNDFPGAYQVEVADVNGDRRPDVIAVGGGTCAWYENPTWKKRIVTGPKQTPGIISSATADLDGDGKAEIAIAYEFEMNEPKRGKLVLAVQGKSMDEPWTVTPVMEGYRSATLNTLGGGTVAGGTETKVQPNRSQRPEQNPQPGSIRLEPPDGFRPFSNLGSIHRLRWGYVLGEPQISPNSVKFVKKLELVVAPIFGPSARPPAFQQEPAHPVLFNTGSDPKSGHWTQIPLNANLPVLHAIDVVELDGVEGSEILAASNLGVTRTYFSGVIAGAPLFRTDVLVPGAPGDAPRKGASEVHAGKLKDGRRFLATVEPWHGTDVAVYLSESLKPLKFGPRNVIDTSLKEGHALWVADVDGDGDDEIFAGYRGPGTSVVMYDANGKSWDRTVIDAKIAAQDLRGGDIDGDGRPDVVAVGGATHNVVWYRPKK